LSCTAPDGQRLRLTLPCGVTPGSALNLAKDSTTQRWSCTADAASGDVKEIHTVVAAELDAAEPQQLQQEDLPLPRDAAEFDLRELAARALAMRAAAPDIIRNPMPVHLSTLPSPACSVGPSPCGSYVPPPVCHHSAAPSPCGSSGPSPAGSYVPPVRHVPSGSALAGRPQVGLATGRTATGGSSATLGFLPRGAQTRQQHQVEHNSSSRQSSLAPTPRTQVEQHPSTSRNSSRQSSLAPAPRTAGRATPPPATMLQQSAAAYCQVPPMQPQVLLPTDMTSSPQKLATVTMVYGLPHASEPVISRCSSASSLQQVVLQSMDQQYAQRVQQQQPQLQQQQFQQQQNQQQRLQPQRSVVARPVASQGAMKHRAQTQTQRRRRKTCC